MVLRERRSRGSRVEVIIPPFAPKVRAPDVKAGTECSGVVHKKWGPRRSRLPGGERRLGIGQDGRARGGRARGPRSRARSAGTARRAGARERDHRGAPGNERELRALLQATKRPSWMFSGVRGPGALHLLPANYGTDDVIWPGAKCGSRASVGQWVESLYRARFSTRSTKSGLRWRRSAMSPESAPRSRQPRMHRSTGRSVGAPVARVGVTAREAGHLDHPPDELRAPPEPPRDFTGGRHHRPRGAPLSARSVEAWRCRFRSRSSSWIERTPRSRTRRVDGFANFSQNASRSAPGVPIAHSLSGPRPAPSDRNFRRGP